METKQGHEHPDPDDPAAGHDMGGMSMWFHGGIDDTILFKFWKAENTGVFVGSLVIVFLMSFTYEALKYWRDKMLQSHREGSNTSYKSMKSEMLSSFHFMQTILHMVQFVLSYFLMLIFMTYNVWLALAVTLGAGTGYFCFGWYKTSSVDITEHCQ